MAYVLHCFDDTPATEDEPHGELGPNHCATIGRNGTIEHPYQVEMWVRDVEKDYSQVMRIECPDLGRTWIRQNGVFEEMKDGDADDTDG